MTYTPLLHQFVSLFLCRSRTIYIYRERKGLVQDRTNLSALAVELLQSCTKLSIYTQIVPVDFHFDMVNNSVLKMIIKVMEIQSYWVFEIEWAILKYWRGRVKHKYWLTRKAVLML